MYDRFGIEIPIEVESIASMFKESVISLSEESCSLSISYKVTDDERGHVRLQIFQRVNVSIHVEEARAGSRNLVLNLLESSWSDLPGQSVMVPKTSALVDDIVEVSTDSNDVMIGKSMTEESNSLDEQIISPLMSSDIITNEVVAIDTNDEGHEKKEDAVTSPQKKRVKTGSSAVKTRKRLVSSKKSKLSKLHQKC